MTTSDLGSPAFKALLKEVLVESLQEHRGFFQEIVTEALEHLALAEAIRQGRETEPVSRDAIFEVLENSS